MSIAVLPCDDGTIYVPRDYSCVCRRKGVLFATSKDCIETMFIDENYEVSWYDVNKKCMYDAYAVLGKVGDVLSPAKAVRVGYGFFDGPIDDYFYHIEKAGITLDRSTFSKEVTLCFNLDSCLDSEGVARLSNTSNDIHLYTERLFKVTDPYAPSSKDVECMKRLVESACDYMEYFKIEFTVNCKFESCYKEKKELYDNVYLKGLQYYFDTEIAKEKERRRELDEKYSRESSLS